MSAEPDKMRIIIDPSTPAAGLNTAINSAAAATATAAAATAAAETTSITPNGINSKFPHFKPSTGTPADMKYAGENTEIDKAVMWAISQAKSRRYSPGIERFTNAVDNEELTALDEMPPLPPELFQMQSMPQSPKEEADNSKPFVPAAAVGTAAAACATAVSSPANSSHLTSASLAKELVALKALLAQNFKRAIICKNPMATGSACSLSITTITDFNDFKGSGYKDQGAKQPDSAGAKAVERDSDCPRGAVAASVVSSGPRMDINMWSENVKPDFKVTATSFDTNAASGAGFDVKEATEAASLTNMGQSLDKRLGSKMPLVSTPCTFQYTVNGGGSKQTPLMMQTELLPDENKVKFALDFYVFLERTGQLAIFKHPTKFPLNKLGKALQQALLPPTSQPSMEKETAESNLISEAIRLRSIEALLAFYKKLMSQNSFGIDKLTTSSDPCFELGAKAVVVGYCFGQFHCVAAGGSPKIYRELNAAVQQFRLSKLSATVTTASKPKPKPNVGNSTNIFN